jgi:hypothetical protein
MMPTLGEKRTKHTIAGEPIFLFFGRGGAGVMDMADSIFRTSNTNSTGVNKTPAKKDKGESIGSAKTVMQRPVWGL